MIHRKPLHSLASSAPENTQLLDEHDQDRMRQTQPPTDNSYLGRIQVASSSGIAPDTAVQNAAQENLEGSQHKQNGQQYHAIAQGEVGNRVCNVADEKGLASVPQDNPAASTRTKCIVAVVVSVLIALGCIGYGAFIAHRNPISYTISYKMKSPTAFEAIGVFINVIITFCIDSMMYIHSVSLRWALYHEQRLEFNTNFRLFKSSRKNGPSAWYANAVALVLLISTYGASSIIFISDSVHNKSIPDEQHSFPDMPAVYQSEKDRPWKAVNGAALITLGISLIGQALVALWCLKALGSAHILSWSSNPLNTTLTVIRKGYLTRREGQCMVSIHDVGDSCREPMKPARRQRSILYAHPYISWILVTV